MSVETQPLPRENNTPNTPSEAPPAPFVFLNKPRFHDASNKPKAITLLTMNVPPRLRPVASAALSLSHADTPTKTLANAHALKAALSMHSFPSVDPTPLTDGSSKHLGEMLAKRNMKSDELAAFESWSENTLNLPTIDWVAFSAEGSQVTEETKQVAKHFKANEKDLAALYHREDVSANDFAKWLSDASLSTSTARAAVLALGRVRRCRLRAAKINVTTSVSAVDYKQRNVRDVLKTPAKNGGIKKDIRVLRAALRHVRKTRTELHSPSEELRELLGDLETQIKRKLESVLANNANLHIKSRAMRHRAASGPARGPARGRGPTRGPVHGPGRRRSVAPAVHGPRCGPLRKNDAARTESQQI